MTGRVIVLRGDAASLPLPDASVDAVVCDPPYGLEFMGREWDSFKPSQARIRTRADNRTNPAQGKSVTSTPESYTAGQPFQAWCLAWAAECLRVLKPGGHLVAFGGTRTYHRLACGIEDAGFEIRDSLHWIYGSGFPKSLDVSKAIDKRPGVGRHRQFAQHLAERREATGLTRADVSERVTGARTGACWNWEHHQFPEAKWWPSLRGLLSLDEEWGSVVAEAEREVIGQRTTGISTGRGAVPYIADSENRDVTAPATGDATRWDGWGTALKPSHEPIVVARKPLAGTVAANVIEYGTGALNIDGCRIGDGGYDAGGATRVPGTRSREDYRTGSSVGPHATADDGRWPPNVMLSEESAAELDRQSGVLTSGANPTRRGSDKFRNAYGDFAGQRECTPQRGTDSGGASRFFPVFRYQAKADASERPSLPDGTQWPTVKPVPLMQWLVRLVTPPGGKVLDLFAGTGTTGQACAIEGFDCILLDKDPTAIALTRVRLGKPVQPSLFGEAS